MSYPKGYETQSNQTQITFIKWLLCVQGQYVQREERMAYNRILPNINTYGTKKISKRDLGGIAKEVGEKFGS